MVRREQYRSQGRRQHVLDVVPLLLAVIAKAVAPAGHLPSAGAFFFCVIRVAVETSVNEAEDEFRQLSL